MELSFLYICNTFSDSISKVNLQDFREEHKINLTTDNQSRVGPHGICVYKDKLLVANNYSNSISIIDINKGIEIENYFIGMHCNDVSVFEDEAYIICGDLNNLIIFDLIKNSICEEIPCGNLPHSIDIDKKNKVLVISNMQNDSITLIDCVDKSVIKNIRVGAYPTKSLFSINGDHILVCESNLGGDSRGSISILSRKNYNVIYKILLGNSPVDMYCSRNKCFVSNFGDGTLSIVDINNYKQLKKINIGGMPRGIIKIGRNIYVGDNYNNLLIKVDMLEESKKVISIGKEPNGMTLAY